MQPSQETRVLAENLTGSTGIWEVGLLRMRAWSVETSILAFCKVGGGDRVGGGTSAVGTTNFNEADGSGDVSSENEYTNVMFWYLFLGKDTKTQGQWYTLQLRIWPLAMASRVLVPAFIIEVSPN